jgi:hypothetical protein
MLAFRDSHEAAMFRDRFQARQIVLDRRDRIGPHHLAIGKTRKLFEHDGVVHAFYSRGYEIAHARLDPETLSPIATRVLPFPAAWGGGAFCVDNAAGRVALVFLHRNQHELCFAQGTIENGEIAWAPWRSLLVSRARQAAPWLELGRDGTAWASVLDRDGDMRLAVMAPDGTARIGDLFGKGETGWYHSCVQVLPVARDKALAVGFRGAFPRETELVFKTVGADLALGPSRTLAPCNVNDRLTFHFQAVGDPARACAHIVYLDDGLSVSHAIYENGEWRIAKSILPVACFAPQITLDGDGNAVLVAAGYDRALWQAAWSRTKGWSQPRKIHGALAPNISPLFAGTGYGTGGMIAAARSETGRVPYLFAVVEDDLHAAASLYIAQLDDPFGFAPDAPVCVRVTGKTVVAEIRLAVLRDADMKQSGRCWLAVVPSGAGRALKIAAAAGRVGLEAQAYWQQRDGSTERAAARVTVSVEPHDAFSHGEYGLLRLSAEFETPPSDINAKNGWAEFYSDGWSPQGGGTLADIAPFDPETAARIAQDPAQAPYSFRRMV